MKNPLDSVGATVTLGVVFAIIVMALPQTPDVGGIHQLGLGRDLVAHLGACLELENAGFHPVELDFQDQLITRLHRAFESGAVDACKVIHGLVIGCLTQGIKGQQGGGLGQPLA